MTQGELVTIFLEKEMRRAAEAGRHNFLKLLAETLQDAGYAVAFAPMPQRHTARGATITYMKPPATRKGLVIRKIYHAPFWQIEQTEKRWEWDVAAARFDPQGLDGPVARKFQRFWRNKLFPGLEAASGDEVYVPLQGILRRQRSFQSCSPLEMVRRVMEATDRPVTLSLHPKETYSERDLAELRAVAGRAKIEMGGMEKILPTCHAIVTMNSSVAFNGYFFAKPAFLFGQIDFHHIGQKKAPDDFADALETPERKAYAKYLHWFWQDQSINAGRMESKHKIRMRLARFGWV